jgi:hypothetical protein
MVFLLINKRSAAPPGNAKKAGPGEEVDRCSSTAINEPVTNTDQSGFPIRELPL